MRFFSTGRLLTAARRLATPQSAEQVAGPSEVAEMLE
jgi:hypothetical protein